MAAWQKKRCNEHIKEGGGGGRGGERGGERGGVRVREGEGITKDTSAANGFYVAD